MSHTRDAEFAAVIDQLMGIRRHSLEPVDDVARVGTAARQRKVLARTAVQRRETRAGHFDSMCRISGLAAEHVIEQAFQFSPLLLVHLFETERGHRRPSSHSATPSTRRVTAGPDRPTSPDAAAASAASSSSLPAVSPGARAASAMIAA